ncbi:hypothetical protein Undi14_11835 [Undibacterium sp. 14-3-2]|jgi:hypothetical protein|uniref:hypothetical protein n=1 Tax=Undibacterium sp. 14-3-2 TaxID=2800129 RepID=UPI001903F940|nr:hypothetical protein [Undibacterium sp. 14-3-2]MBK1890724.1 hypothetical protein [Undibacterium sp. 14-3-2]
MNTKYRYTGPLSGVTLASGQEVMLNPDSEIELSEQDTYTKTLLALGHLTQMPTAKNSKVKGENDGR